MGNLLTVWIKARMYFQSFSIFFLLILTRFNAKHCSFSKNQFSNSNSLFLGASFLFVVTSLRFVDAPGFWSTTPRRFNLSIKSWSICRSIKSSFERSVKFISSVFLSSSATSRSSSSRRSWSATSGGPMASEMDSPWRKQKACSF